MIRKVLSGLVKCILFVAFLLALAVFSGMLTIHYIFAIGDVEVPEVTGKDMVVAVDLLAENHLNLKIVDRQFDPEIKAEYILGQDPPAGTLLRKNRTVRVVVSKGAESSTIPDVIGKRWQDANRTLKQHAFRVGHVAYVHTTEAPVDHIVAQMPFAHTEGQRGDAVNLLVSLGPYKTVMVMPDLVEEQLAYGMQVIDKLGLVLGKVERDPQYPLPPNTIINQVPKPGTLIEEQNIVNLVVSGAAETGRGFSNVSLPVSYETLEYTVPIGAFEREVFVMVRNAEGSSEIFRQIVSSGQRLMFQIPVVGETVVQIYLDGGLEEVRRLGNE